MRSALGLLVATLALSAPQQQNQPVFRARVDLVTVDVAVVDADGKPVTVLAPGDFTIVADGRPRRVLSADWVTVSSNPATRTAASAPRLPSPSSNSSAASGRSFLIVVDVDHMATGTGRVPMEGIGDYLDRLPPEDRVGIVALPYGSPRVDLTTNRQVIKDAVRRIRGVSGRNQGGTMTVGEAAAIEQMDALALDRYLERVQPTERPENCVVPTELVEGEFGARIDPKAATCIMRFQPYAIAVMDAERRRTRDLLDTLGSLAGAMSAIEGPKGIILISEGLITDLQTTYDVQRFAEAAERARVTLYAINLPTSLADVTSRFNMTHAHVLDAQYLLDGMATMAVAGRGDLYQVSGTPAPAHMARIDAEMAGYYLLSFERDARDRDGDRSGISVKVNWPGALVRARKDFTINPMPPEPKPAKTIDLKKEVGSILRWPVATTDLGVDLDTYTAPTGADDVKTLVAASFASAGQAIAAVGYEVTDAAGKIVADDFQPVLPAVPGGVSPSTGPVPTIRVAGDRQLFLAGVSLPPGTFRLKLAAIAEDGRRGSVEHEFTVARARAGALRISDVFVGQMTASGFMPSPSLLPGTQTLPVSIELYADTPDAFTDAKVTLELSRAEAPPLATMPLSVKSSGDDRRRQASATVAIGALPAGEYVVTVVLNAGTGASLRRSRTFYKR